MVNGIVDVIGRLKEEATVTMGSVAEVVQKVVVGTVMLKHCSVGVLTSGLLMDFLEVEGRLCLEVDS